MIAALFEHTIFSMAVDFQGLCEFRNCAPMGKKAYCSFIILITVSKKCGHKQSKIKTPKFDCSATLLATCATSEYENAGWAVIASSIGAALPLRLATSGRKKFML